MRISHFTFISFCLFFFLILSIPDLSYGQDEEDAEIDHIAAYKSEARQMVSFLQFSMNVLGDNTNSAKEKDIIINESYAKIFKDDKVQIEDDLDEHRDVVTNKDVQAYLKDVDFFFKQVKFEFTILDIADDVNQEGQLFFTIKMMRNLKGITVDNDSIDSDQERYIEVNVDEENKDIKIASIYTTKLSRNEELTYWWSGLDREWQSLLGADIEVKEGLMLSEIQEFSDSTYMVDDLQIIDSIKIIDFVLKAAGRDELNLSENKSLVNLKPLDQLKKLRDLDISSSNIIDLFPIRNLTTIEKLNCSNTSIENLRPLKYSKSLRKLYFNNTPVSSIIVIENFHNLELLHLSQTVIDSLPSIHKLINLKELNCSSTNLVRLDSIKYLSSLVSLDFSNTSVNDLSPISTLKNLKKLTFRNTNVMELAPLSLLDSLEEINCESSKVKDLNALKDLGQLKVIRADKTEIDLDDFIAFNKIRPDVKMIFMTEELMSFWENMDAEWTKILGPMIELSDTLTTEIAHKTLEVSVLDIHNNPDILNLSPLKYMPQLNTLNFSNTQISDLSPLENLHSLTILIGSNTQVTDLSPIKNLSELMVINFSNTSINDISSLSGMAHIDTLLFNHTSIKNIDPLNSMKDFKTAYFEYTLVKDEDFIKLEFDDLKSIVVYKTDSLRAWWGRLDDEWQNIFKDTYKLPGRPSPEQLHQLVSKKELTIKSISLNNLDAIPAFIRLKRLTFTDSQITSLYPLVSLKQLEQLRCPRNPIAEIEALSSLKQLRILDLDNTQISHLKAISSLTELRELKFSGTNVKDLSPVSSLKNLEVLECSKTKIKQIKALTNLNSLKVLKCYNNKISPKKIEDFKSKHPDCDVVFY